MITTTSSVATKATERSDYAEGWANSVLGEIGEYLNGRAFKTSEWATDGRPIIRIQDLTFSRSNPNYYDGEIEERYIVRSGDLLISWSATLGAYVWSGPEGVLNQHIFKVRSHILPVFHYRLAQHIIGDLYRETHGSGIVHITKSDFEQIPISLPPIAEQKRIVAKLDTLFQKLNASRDRLAKVPSIVKRFRQSVLAAACSGKLTEDWRQQNPPFESGAKLLERLLAERKKHWTIQTRARRYREPDCFTESDLHDLPDSWVWATFDQCSWEITVGHVGPMKDRYVDEGIPFLRSQNVRPLSFDPRGLVRIPSGFHGRLSKSRLSGGEILVVRSGANTGDSCVYPFGSLEANCSDLVITRPLPSLLGAYGAVFVVSPEGQRRLMFRETGMAQPHFNIGEMRKKPVPLPPLDEQHEIVRRVEALFKLAAAIEKRVASAQARADKLTQSVLAKAFRGELVPTEAELARQEGRDYEPASVLLERIMAERLASIQKPERRKGTVAKRRQ